MKRSLILSTIVHMGIIVGLFLSSPVKPMLQGYPTIYRVGLVSMPRKGGGGKGSPGEATKAKLTVSKQEKGVSVKELNKTPSKKKKTKKTLPKKTRQVNAKKDTPEKKETGKITQEDEFGAEYGLGNGISAATVDGGGFGSSYYLSLVFGRIRDLWDNPVQASAILQVTIYFKILKDGQILDAQVEKSSGIDLFDQSAMRAIISSAPLPPLPTEYRGEYLGIHLEFEYIQ
ncbi:MAG: TonB C-terminal domain-containing protein [Candidatus Zixiibacteriota bacterium]|nr:MAG: TonB C-terminal domain-containing protein [candidate division Zixibacteria bacterium]